MAEESSGPQFISFKSIKTSLRSIIRNEEHLEIIHKTVLTAHKIIIHTLQFMKLYFISLYENKKKFPKINQAFIMKIIRMIRDNNHLETRDESNNELLNFYRKYYSPTIYDREEFNCSYINGLFEYASKRIVTDYENNIKQHYVEYIERFINVVYKKDEKIKNMKDKEKREFIAKLRDIKYKVLMIKELPDFGYKLQEHMNFIIPKYKDKNVMYYLESSPQEHLPCMIYMMKHIEGKNKTVYNVFPLRSNIIPKYVRLDTVTIARLLIKTKRGEKINTGAGKLTKTNLTDNISKYQRDIWDLLFDLSDRRFGFIQPVGSYKFHHMIETDGVACSILLDRPLNKEPEKKKEKYIDDLEEKDYAKLERREIVGIDPGKSDLIYCSSKTKKFRYTQNQRRKETKNKEYSKLTEKLKKETVVEGRTVEEWEAKLSGYDRKTLDFDDFLLYIRKKNKVNSKVMDFYSNTPGYKDSHTKHLFQKLKWGRFINTQKSEQKMINNFKEKFGKPDEVVIGFGDWEQKRHMKFHEPTKGVGMRSLFRKAGYDVYLVDEKFTSKHCYECGKDDEIAVCEKFLMVNNPRLKMGRYTKSGYERENEILCHGLVRCKTCNRFWNRDRNGSLNIRQVVRSTIRSRERPRYLT